VISEGLEAGDRVVVEGRQKVRDGVAVKPRAMVIGEDGKLAPDPSAPAPAPAAPGGEKKD
jgi:hypothetical protein